MSKRIGILHPGRMGASVGAAAKAAGKGRGVVSWVSEGRGAQTRRRADEAGLRDVGTLAAMCDESDVIVSVCPPAAAIDVATRVAEHGFGGVFVDANAVSPATTVSISAIVARAGARFVDAGIVGPPARRPDTTRLYLSGPEADEVAAIFRGSVLQPVVIDGGAGAASALKMCYAAWTKGTAALLIAVRALASATGVEAALLEEWSCSQPGLEKRSADAAHRDGPKAWRFAGEMREIAATFEGASLPAGFHAAAAEVYERMAGFKDREPPPSIQEAVETLLGGQG